MRWYRRVLRKCVGESGATFMEYAFLAALIAVGLAVVWSVWGDKVAGLITSSGDKAEEVGDATSGADIHLPE